MGGNTEFKNRVIYTHKTRQKIKGKMFGTLLVQLCVLVAPLVLILRTRKCKNNLFGYIVKSKHFCSSQYLSDKRSYDYKH